MHTERIETSLHRANVVVTTHRAIPQVILSVETEEGIARVNLTQAEALQLSAMIEASANREVG